MSDRVWTPYANVLVCGVENGNITECGSGSQRFRDLNEARSVFPDLDPEKSTSRFTHSMGDPTANEMRFETWAANKLYST